MDFGEFERGASKVGSSLHQDPSFGGLVWSFLGDLEPETSAAQSVLCKVWKTHCPNAPDPMRSQGVSP